MRIAGLISTCGEAFTHRAIASLIPWVDEVIAVVDDKAPVGFAESLGVEYHYFTWCEDFAFIPNFGMALLKDRSDWVAQLDADELLYDGGNLRRIIEHNAHHADAIGLPRRHWHDLARTHECQNPAWYPDWQYRVRVPRVRMIEPDHPQVEAGTRVIRSSLVTIEHFNLLRTPEEWAEKNALFARLGAKRRSQ